MVVIAVVVLVVVVVVAVVALCVNWITLYFLSLENFIPKSEAINNEDLIKIIGILRSEDGEGSENSLKK